jgi:hypothetical protein
MEPQSCNDGGATPAADYIWLSVAANATPSPVLLLLRPAAAAAAAAAGEWREHLAQ